MNFSMGLDIGGTKIAGALFDSGGNEAAQKTVSTPADYSDFLNTCVAMIREFDRISGAVVSVGIGIPGAIDHARDSIFAPNVACVHGKTFRKDLESALLRPVAIGNDASCAALSEAMDGAGAGHRIVFGAIMGTGIGGGLVVDGRIVEGPNGLTGEWGHLPLPFYEESDGPAVPCGCGQNGCIEKLICGAGLARLHEQMTGEQAEAAQIGKSARAAYAASQRTLDRFYTTVAKAMVTILHTCDPEIIVVSGGMNDLPGMYEEVPKRWGRYAVRKDIQTKIVPAKHGATSGIRGAAWLGRRT